MTLNLVEEHNILDSNNVDTSYDNGNILKFNFNEIIQSFHLDILLFLEKYPMSTTIDLKSIFNITTSTLHRTLSKLEENSLIRSEINLQNSRVLKFYELTIDGLITLSKIRDILNQI